MALGPIPWLAIQAYAQHHCIRDADEFEYFHAVVADMDGAYMKYVERKQAAK
jgi:hypothetical protein